MGALTDAAIGIGTTAANDIIGTGLGLMLEKHNDNRQYNQQARLQALQIQGQKEMSSYNMEQQYQMWLKTNYPAQMEQLKEAGLNPGLIYGMGGAGGATTGSASGNVTGAEAPKGGNEVLNAMGIQMQSAQLSLLNAQRQNIEADTQKKQAEATKTGGIDTQLAQTQITKLTADTANTQADTNLKQVQTEWQHVQTSLAEDTYQDTADQIQYAAQKSGEELRILKYQRKLDGATLQAKTQIIQAEAIGAILRNELTKAQTTQTQTAAAVNTQQLSVMNKEIEKMSNDILMAQGELANQTYEANTGRMKQIVEAALAQFQINNPEIWKQIGGSLKAGSQKIDNIVNQINDAFTKLRTGKLQ